MSIDLTKVMIIFPSYNPREGTHLPYWYKVFERSGKKLSLAIVFESGQNQVQISNLSQVQVQRFTQKPFNLVERTVIILRLILSGYRNIYIHYSLYSFVIAWLLRPMFGLKIYLWDCERYRRISSNRLLVWAIRQSDVLVTGGQSIAKAYRQVFKLGDKPILVVSNYVNKIKAQKMGLERSNKHILFVHHLSPRKGSRELPEIISQLLTSRRDLVFHIVGSGPDKNWLETQTKKYQQQVLFYGQIDRCKVAGLMSSCDLLIMPSRSEGFPRVILEAMLYGLPFVSFDVGNVAELSGKLQTDYIVPVGEVKQFVNTCVKLLNYNKVNILVAQNKARTKEYNLERSSREFVELFSKD